MFSPKRLMYKIYVSNYTFHLFFPEYKMHVLIHVGDQKFYMSEIQENDVFV